MARKSKPGGLTKSERETGARLVEKAGGLAQFIRLIEPKRPKRGRPAGASRFADTDKELAEHLARYFGPAWDAWTRSKGKFGMSRHATLKWFARSLRQGDLDIGGADDAIAWRLARKIRKLNTRT